MWLRVDPRTDTNKYRVKKRKLDYMVKHAKCFIFDDWGVKGEGFYDHLVSKKIFTLTIFNIFMWTAYIIRQMATYAIIILLRFITMLCGTDNIVRNILHIETECEEYYVKYCQSHKAMLWIWICYDLYVLIISHKLRVSLSYGKCIAKRKSIPITHAYLKG